MGDVHALRAALESAKPEVPLTLIFAANLSRAHEVARDRRLEKGKWRYVTRLDSLRPYRGPGSCVVIIAASWYGQGVITGAEMNAIKRRLTEANLTHEFDGNH